MLFNTFLFLVSVLIYILSPYYYEEIIIWADLIIFISGTLYIFINAKEKFNILSFNVIFLLSFFFCTYSYALFVIGAGVEFSMTIFNFVNFDYITKAISLSTIAITSYFLSYSYLKRNRRTQIPIIDCFNASKLKLLGNIRSLLFICVVINYFYFIAKGGSSFSITSAPFLPELYKEFLIVYLIINSYNYKLVKFRLYDILMHNKRSVIESIILCILYIIGGDRGFPISIVFIFLGVYSFFYYRIKIIQFSLITIIGVVILFALRVTRGSENSLSEGGIMAVTSTTKDAISGQSVILLFSDLMGTSVEMCLGYEYVQEQGLTTPSKIFLIPLQPFPFLPSIAGELMYGKVPYELSAGYILNDYIGRSIGYNSSLGNHVVIDIYMHWGIIGVILSFFILGRCISYLEHNKYTTLFIASSYIFLLSFALYLPRDSMFTLLRPIVFIWFIIHFFHINKNENKIILKY